MGLAVATHLLHRQLESRPRVADGGGAPPHGGLQIGSMPDQFLEADLLLGTW